MICQDWTGCTGFMLSLLGALVALVAELRRGLRRTPIPAADPQRYKWMYRAGIAAIVVGLAMEFGLPLISQE